MPLTGLILALLSALGWVGFDVGRKRLGRDMAAATALWGVMSAVALLVLPVVIAGALAPAGPEAGAIERLLRPAPPPPTTEYYGWLALVSALNVISNLMYLRAVQLSPLSLTIPYLSFTPIFSGLLALVIYGEQPAPLSWLGIAVVAIGAFVLNPGQGKDPLAPLRALRSEKGSLLMLGVALLFSLTPIVDKRAIAFASPLTHILLGSTTLACAYAGLCWRRDRSLRPSWEEVREDKVWVGLCGLVFILGISAQLASYEFLAVAVVETWKRAFGLIGAVLVGWWVFGEKDLGRRLTGAIVMALGVALVLLGGSAKPGP